MSAQPAPAVVIRETAGPRSQPPMWYWARVTLTVLGVLLLAYLFYRVRSVALAVFLGFFLAVGFDPFVERLQRRGLGRGAAVLAFFVLFFVAISAFLAVALQPLISQTDELVRQVPALIEQLQNRNSAIGGYLADLNAQNAVQDALKSAPRYLATSVGTVFGVLGAVVGGLFSLFTVVALMAYFMLALPSMREYAHRALHTQERIDVMEEALAKVGGYVSGQLAICAIAGVSAYIFMVIAGVPYSAVLALAVAILVAIPQVGAIIAAVLCTAVALTVSVNLALVTFVFFLVYQQVENYVLVPRIFARAINLSPVAVFIAVLAGAALAGVVGALTALPITAALKTVFRYTFRRQIAKVGGGPAPVTSLESHEDVPAAPYESDPVHMPHHHDHDEHDQRKSAGVTAAAEGRSVGATREDVTRA